jgi:hypothetical protein
MTASVVMGERPGAIAGGGVVLLALVAVAMISLH